MVVGHKTVAKNDLDLCTVCRSPEPVDVIVAPQYGTDLLEQEPGGWAVSLGR